ncbi:MAG: signal peptidase I [Chlorobi bacterium]|nr:signal peptidase I [Chlorobiota bacterium]
MPSGIRQYIITVLLLTVIAFSVWSKNIYSFIFLTAILSVFYIDKTYFTIKNHISKQSDKTKNYTEWFIAVVAGTLLTITFNTYIAGFYKVKSISMQPEYKTGDVVLVDKLRAGPSVHINDVNRFRRLKGFGELKRYDVIVFHFPEGDTVLKNRTKDNYYYLKRQYRNKSFINNDEFKDVVFKPVSKRTRYIKRLIALPGDTLIFREGEGVVNGKDLPPLPTELQRYIIKKDISQGKREVILNYARDQFSKNGRIIVELSRQDIEKNGFSNLIKKDVLPLNLPDQNIFPFSLSFFWNKDNFGPIVIPVKGQTVKLTLSNLPLYSRIISAYEENKLEIKDNKIFINGKQAGTYTFKMNYYWVMGDNRPHSFDSRYWGFVPDNHIIGIVDKKLYNSN